MQHPLDFLQTLKSIHGELRFNILREYLQVMALKILYKAKGSEYLRFGGGTCIRICHNLPRFSEDLDFSLEKKSLETTALIEKLQHGFRDFNVDFELAIPKSVERKRVAKYWLKFPNLLHPMGRSPHPSEKLAIKLEIDKHPPKKGKGEFFYVTTFKEYFPIYKSDLPTLFAGKISALCQRGYHAMRDFYDILWYLNKGIEPNYEELEELDIPIKARDRKSLIEVLRNKTQHVDGEHLVATIEQFLEHPEEKKVLRDYNRAFTQAAERYLEKV